MNPQTGAHRRTVVQTYIYKYKHTGIQWHAGRYRHKHSCTCRHRSNTLLWTGTWAHTLTSTREHSYRFHFVCVSPPPPWSHPGHFQMVTQEVAPRRGAQSPGCPWSASAAARSRGVHSLCRWADLPLNSLWPAQRPGSGYCISWSLIPHLGTGVGNTYFTGLPRQWVRLRKGLAHSPAAPAGASGACAALTRRCWTSAPALHPIL